MEASSSMKDNNCRSLYETRIEGLPDEILLHILSFIWFKDAVRTCVLSKRWRLIWLNVPALRLKERFFGQNRTSFINFVDRVFALRESNIRECSLPCRVLSDVPLVRTWISCIVAHGVKKLDLQLGVDEELNLQKDNDVQSLSIRMKEDEESLSVLPHCLFSSKTILSLSLGMSYLYKLPSHIHMSTLKVLTLASICFQDKDSMEKLFFGCPAVEVLNKYNCSWRHLNTVFISAPKLRDLDIMDSNEDDCDPELSCLVEMNASCLKNFFYEGDFRNYFYLNESTSLDRAWLHMECLSSIEDEERTWDAAVIAHSHLRQFSDVKELSIFDKAIEALDHIQVNLDMPEFCNLTSLVLNGEPTSNVIEALLRILYKSPIVTSIVFKLGLSCFPDNFSWGMDLIPSCFLTHLKTIAIYSVTGNENEMYAIEVLLESAAVLEKVIFKFDPTPDLEGQLEKQNQIYQKIQKLERANTCEIVFK